MRRCALGKNTLRLFSRGGVEDTRLEAKAIDSPSEDRPSRGQGHEPRTQAQKKVFKKFFLGDLQKKVFKNFFRAFSSKKRLLKFFFRRSTKCQTFKKRAVLEPRTGQFSRTWGLEAKDLTFEAKDFKMCPRGHGRPRGLHLCYFPLGSNSLLVMLAQQDERLSNTSQKKGCSALVW